MIRYFISYNDYKKDSIDDKNFYKKIKILKKDNNGNFRNMPVSYFDAYFEDVKDLIDVLKDNQKSVYLMIELSKEEQEKYDRFLVKKFNTLNDNNNILKIKKENINLISYNIYSNMTNKELESGYFVKVTSDNNVKYIKMIDKLSIFEERDNLEKNTIIDDVYYCTNNEEILEKYNSYLTVLNEEDINKYSLKEHSFFAIDSIPQDRVYDMNSASIQLLFRLCNDSIPVYMSENEDNFDVSLKKHSGSKKSYMIVNHDLMNLIHDSSIDALLKYINIYELDKFNYKKVNAVDYLKRKDVLKYVKKLKNRG